MTAVAVVIDDSDQAATAALWRRSGEGWQVVVRPDLTPEQVILGRRRLDRGQVTRP